MLRLRSGGTARPLRAAGGFAARASAGGLALLLASVAEPSHSWAAGDDLFGQLEGVLNAELAECEKIKAMSAVELDAAKATLTAPSTPEQDVAKLKAAERALAEARRHLKSAEDALADRITKAKLEAKSAIDYEQGEVNKYLAQSAPLDERLKAIEGEMKTLEAAIAKAMKALENDTFGVGKEPATEKERLAALKTEREGVVAQLKPIADEMQPHKEKLEQLKTELSAAEEKANAAMKARISGAQKEVERTEKEVEAVRKRIADGGRDKAVAAELSRPGLLECIATREAELKVESGEGLGTPETSATTAAVTAGGEVVPQPAPGSQPFSSAGLEGKAWPGTYTLTCKDAAGKPETTTGAAEFRFTGSKASLHLKLDKSSEPIEVDLDPLGAFAYHHGDTGGEFGMSGQFQLATGADGSARPTGRGKLDFAIDFSWLGGLVSSLGTLGMGVAEEVELTPEEREANMMRCDGSWTLPPG